jgi:hypothetical protein
VQNLLVIFSYHIELIEQKLFTYYLYIFLYWVTCQNLISVDAAFDDFCKKVRRKLGARLACYFFIPQRALLNKFLYHMELIVNMYNYKY